MHKTKQVFSQVGEKKKVYNILTFNTHERYQTQVAKTGHNFYAFNYKNGKDWFSEHAPMPENYYQLPPNNIFSGIEFDFIMSHSKFGQLQTAQEINRRLQIPIVNLEHTLPLQNWPHEHLTNLRNMVGDVNVFITKYSRQVWDINASSDVIYHSIDTEQFAPASDIDRKYQVLTVAHDFINRDYALNYQGWDRITNGLNRVVVGETEGLSKAAESVDDLVRNYQESLVYINPSVLSPVPTSMLEAMSCGCAVVSTATCEIPKIIEHGVNGFMSNSEEELRGYLDQLLANPELAIKMGQAARETVKEKFSEERFINEWNNIFDKTYGVIK
jgi:glycosyltransferase involved in cell wall biosynthesis